MSFAFELEKYGSERFNGLEPDETRRTWNGLPLVKAGRGVYFKRQGWWEAYRTRHLKRPLFYLVMWVYTDHPSELCVAARVDSYYITLHEAPKLPDGLEQYFADRGVVGIPDQNFQYRKDPKSYCMDIGRKYIPLPDVLLRNGRINENENPPNEFLQQIFTDGIVNNQPIFEFLKFLREQNI